MKETSNTMAVDWIAELSPDDPRALERAVSTPAVISAAVKEIGSAAVGWSVESAHRMLDLAMQEFRLAGEFLQPQEWYRWGCESCLLTVLTGLHRGTPVREITSPPEIARSAQFAVRQGVTMELVIRVMWACYAQSFTELSAFVSSHVDTRAFASNFESLSATLFGYLDVFIRDLVKAFSSEIVLWHGKLAAARRRVIDEIVRTGTAPYDAERVMGIRLDLHHLAAVAWRAQDEDADTEADEAMSRFSADAAEALGADTKIVLPRDDGSTEILWGFTTVPDEDTWRSALDSTLRPRWMNVAVGTLSAGAKGIRESVLTARRAEGVGRLRGEQTTTIYEDVNLIAFLAADPDAARIYVRRILAGLTDEDRKTADLRETLRLYLRSGRSRAAAAAALHIVPNTVVYRVKRAEELLGRDSSIRSVETLIALELVHALPRFLN